MKKIDPRDIYLPFDEIFVHFLNELQEANEFLEQPIVVSSVTEELRNKRHFLETFEVESFKRLNIRHHWLLRVIAQKHVFQFTFFPQLTVLNTVTIPQIIHFLRS